MKATNLSQMKESNKKLILRLINQNKYSRASIAIATGLTKAAISLIVDELIDEGLVYEEESDYRGVGRKPINLFLNPNAKYSVGINITRNHIEVGVVDLTGNVICEKKQRFPSESPNVILSYIAKIVKELLSKSNVSSEKLLGIGVTAPGPIDSKGGIILSPTFKALHNIGFSSLEGEINTRVYLENISNSAALCERYFGSCKAIDDYILIRVEDGIDAGIILGGKLYRGGCGLGSEFGHISIDYKGTPCDCGNVGCLERYACIPSILKGSPYSSWEEVIDAQDYSLMEKEAEYLSAALVTAVNLFDLRKIVLGGRLQYKGEMLAKMISAKLCERAITKTDFSVTIQAVNEGVTLPASIVVDKFLNCNNEN